MITKHHFVSGMYGVRRSDPVIISPVIHDFRNRGGAGRPQKADSYAEWVNSRLEQILYSDDESLKENFGF